MISSKAEVHPKAIIHPSVQVRSFATIENDVVIGKGTCIGANAVIMSGSRIGENCHIFPGAIVGSHPQDLKYKGEPTQLYIGNNTIIREFATVNKGTLSKGRTIIGDNVLIMAYSHIGHDCEIGDYSVIGNATHIAGEVIVDPYATISAAVLIHQFTHIGKLSMIQGGSKVNKDIPPFIKVGREPLTFLGINSIGLVRRGFITEEIEEIKSIYRIVYDSTMNTSQSLEKVKKDFKPSNIQNVISSFIKNSQRGIIKKT